MFYIYLYNNQLFPIHRVLPIQCESVHFLSDPEELTQPTILTISSRLLLVVFSVVMLESKFSFLSFLKSVFFIVQLQVVTYFYFHTLLITFLALCILISYTTWPCFHGFSSLLTNFSSMTHLYEFVFMLNVLIRFFKPKVLLLLQNSWWKVY